MTLPERFPLGIIEPVANLVLGYVRQIPGVAQANWAIWLCTSTPILRDPI